MTLEFTPQYHAARTVLLDALEALGAQRQAVVVVGAQAIYLRIGDGGVAGVAPYTTDADLTITPGLLDDEPHIESLMQSAGFEQRGEPGVWWKSADIDGKPTDIEVDIMVAEGYAPGGGRRSVHLPPHGKMIARRALGLEGAVLDYDEMEVSSLDDVDKRRFIVRVAGPAALVVAKLYKLRDRINAGNEDRIADKDAADVYRLMLAVPAVELAARLRPLLQDETAAQVCVDAVEFLRELFGARRARGVVMAADALRVAVPEERVAEVCTTFVRDVRSLVAVP